MKTDRLFGPMLTDKDASDYRKSTIMRHIDLDHGAAYAVWRGYTNAGKLILGKQGLNMGYMEFFTGYALVPKPVFEDKYEFDVPNVHVHGGITYSAPHYKNGWVYGFDCAHAGDEHNEHWKDVDNVLYEALTLYLQIMEVENYTENQTFPTFQLFYLDIAQKAHAILNTI